MSFNSSSFFNILTHSTIYKYIAFALPQRELWFEFFFFNGFTDRKIIYGFNHKRLQLEDGNVISIIFHPRLRHDLKAKLTHKGMMHYNAMEWGEPLYRTIADCNSEQPQVKHMFL